MDAWGIKYANNQSKYNHKIKNMKKIYSILFVLAAVCLGTLNASADEYNNGDVVALEALKQGDILENGVVVTVGEDGCEFDYYESADAYDGNEFYILCFETYSDNYIVGDGTADSYDEPVGDYFEVNTKFQIMSISEFFGYQFIDVVPYSASAPQFDYAATVANQGYDYYGTFYADYAWFVPEDMNAYYVSEVADGEAVFQEFTGVVPANQGVVLRSMRYNASIKIVPSTEDDGVTPAVNLLCGTTTDSDVDEEGYTYYVLTRDESNTLGFFWQYGSDKGDAVHNGAHKAYLRVPNGSGGLSNGFTFRFEDVTTGISTAAAASAETLYNLMGQKCVNAQRGVYVKNSKVVIR